MAALLQDPRYGDTAKVRANLGSAYEFVLDIVADTRTDVRPLRDAYSVASAERKESLLRSVVFRTLANEWMRDLSEATGSPDVGSSASLLRACLYAVTEGRTEDLPFGVSSFESMPAEPKYALAEVWAAEMKSDLETAAQQRVALLTDSNSARRYEISEMIRSVSDIDAELAASVLPHLDVVCLLGKVEDGEPSRPMMESSSHYSMPGAIFIAEHATAVPMAFMEALVHESTHQKYFDIVATFEIFRVGYSPTTSASVTIPWNAHRPPILREWAADRVLIALHVYVHLARFFTALAAIDPTASEDSLAAAERCLERSWWLGAASAGPLAGEFALEGRAFCDWIVERVQEAWLWSHDSLPDIDQLSRELLVTAM